MNFRFALAAVLSLREGLEERAQLRLERTQLEVSHCRQALEMVPELQRAVLSMRERQLAAATPAAELHFQERTRQGLRARARALQGHLSELLQTREQQLEAYQAARRDRQALSELRDRQLLEFEARLARQQQRRADDQFLSNSRRG